MSPTERPFTRVVTDGSRGDLAVLRASRRADDFDAVGVPEGADRRWRHRMTEMWARLAVEYQDRGVDLLLTGQSPLGVVLATPSAPLLDGIAVCLVDVSDEVRRARLAERDCGRWDAQAVDSLLGWAAWHREHALDPQHRPHVIVQDSWPEMVWGRRTEWDAGDPRWGTELLWTPPTGQSRSAQTTSSSGSTSSAGRKGPADSP
ncbi:hypothetical protein [Streptomyces sp. NPDC091215]|uniref:hypothetical protein n=1 Tax=Streptomyces sp. NPDC091215 TaxID=3155192 RepID=UPI0034198801